MENLTQDQIKHIRKHVKSLLNEGMAGQLSLHNWENTKENVKLLEKIAKLGKVEKSVNDIALVATYFQYTGFTDTDADSIYNRSMELARVYMRDQEYSDVFIESVLNCLKIRVERKTADTEAAKLYQDISDAYFGQKKLSLRIKLSWEESNLLSEEKTDLLTKQESVLEKMTDHKYNLAASRNLFRFKKLQNTAKLQSKIEKARNNSMLGNNKTAMTMFKTALRNHIDLINIADKKAGIMISINAILMTVMIPILGSYVIDVSKFIVPSIILIVTCGAAVILATLATRPQVSDGSTDDENRITGEKSLFYFGNFFKMDKSEYNTAIKDVIVRDTTLENSIINDLYELGYILGIKYKRLRWCYFIFAGGIALTLISFIVSMFVFPEF